MEHALRTYRLNQTPKVSLAALAEDIGASKASLSRIERFKQEPSLDLLRRLLAATPLSADDFLRQEAAE